MGPIAPGQLELQCEVLFQHLYHPPQKHRKSTSKHLSVVVRWPVEMRTHSVPFALSVATQELPPFTLQ